MSIARLVRDADAAVELALGQADTHEGPPTGRLLSKVWGGAGGGGLARRSPGATPVDPAVDKAAFQLDEEAGTLTCPGGQTVADVREVKDGDGRLVRQFTFAREVCAAGPLFGGCVRR